MLAPRGTPVPRFKLKWVTKRGDDPLEAKYGNGDKNDKALVNGRQAKSERAGLQLCHTIGVIRVSKMAFLRQSHFDKVTVQRYT